MSIIANNSQENNEAAFLLRKLFCIIEDKKRNKELNNKSSELIEKYQINNINFEKLNIIDSHPKNKYRVKLRQILFKKNLFQNKKKFE